MNWKDKNILITGVGGFAGSYLAEELLNQKANVYGLIRRRADGTKAKNLIDHGIENSVKTIEGDLTEITSLTNALEISEPEYIFHLAAQSFVPRSFENSPETQMINCIGTANLLDATRKTDSDAKVVFAGSSEEYGLVISTEDQYKQAKKEYGTIFPEPVNIPEVPIKETNPLRPMSPYAVSKVYGDHLMQNYYHSYGLNTVVSRAFNHEGAGRGLMFVTSVVTNQVMKLKFGEIDKITIGNLNAFRDWSHVKDIVNGYMTLAENGKSGEVYNQGSMRTNSVLSYILLGLKEAGWNIGKIETFNGDKSIENPTEIDDSAIYEVKFDKTVVDTMILDGKLEYTLEDRGIKVHTDKGIIPIEFNPDRFRPAEVPILFADTEKIQGIGATIEHSLNDIIRDQLNYFLKKENRL
ncbi:GDP-mannose 4,6-dehydratase [Methanobacterium spitsbergense]|uniref:GDP-mannose 4,6-dehydratase n=1 Tax=Methanobacterium spitsbergense TaxID=2874285 RepID=A0A8T5UZI0_9EURY|nr:GDP-mannose 4,6-dehydratase [Methanobacterium spitsbergense]MBZ2166570.1 GDP-mannose 4,6-dehydratase [Methanobacterium spitsbergense]